MGSDVPHCQGDKQFEYLMLNASPLKHVKRGRDTKIPQSSGPPIKVGDEAVHKELGDIIERAATTASSLEAEQDNGSGPRVKTLGSGEDSMKLMELMAHCTTLSELRSQKEMKGFITASHIKNALTEGPILYASHIDQFWQTAALSTNEDEVRGITATIDKRSRYLIVKVITLRPPLEDISSLRILKPNFSKWTFSPQWKFFIHTILHWLSPKKTDWEQFSSNIATAIICLATNRTFNFSNLIFKAMVKNIDSRSKFLMYPRFIQIFLNKRKGMLFPHKKTFPTPTLTQKLFSNMKRDSKGYSGVDIPLFPTMLTTPESSPSRITSSPSLSPQTHPLTSHPPSTPQSNQIIPVTEEASPMPHESPLQSVYSLRRDEGSLSLHELTNLCTSLSKKVASLEYELKQIKQTYNAALTKLINMVKKLEQTIKTSQAKRRAKVVISDDEEAEEDPSN
ncbi:hypothetical protein Tco_0536149 [Tanacetum coccineum]